MKRKLIDRAVSSARQFTETYPASGNAARWAGSLVQHLSDNRATYIDLRHAKALVRAAHRFDAENRARGAPTDAETIAKATLESVRMAVHAQGVFRTLLETLVEGDA